MDENIITNQEEITNHKNDESYSFIKEIVSEIMDNVVNNNSSQYYEKKKSEFYDHLMNAVKTQENILNMTGINKQKLITANEVANSQLKTVKEKFNKYGRFLKLIQTELFTISDLMKKIKLEVQNKK